MFTNIAIEKITGHPDNPRRDLGDLAELAASIKENGILQNLTVVPNAVDNDRYIAVIGHRRLAAAKLAGLTEVPCAIAEMDIKTQVSTMLLENMQRSDLTPFEQAQGFQMMLDLGVTMSDISQKTGFSETTVRRRTKLLELDSDKFKLAVDNGATLADFAELEKISSPEVKNELLDKIGTSNFNYSLQNAVDNEKKAAQRAELIALLNTFATEIEDAEGYKQVRYIYNYEISDFEIPEDADEKKYFYTASKYSIILYVEHSEEREAPDTSKVEKQQRIEAAKSQLQEITKRAFQLRMEFVQYYSAAKAKKNIHAIIEFSISNTIDNNYSSFDEKMLLEMLNIELGEDEEFSFDTISRQFASYPEKLLLLTTYCTDADDSRWDYYDWQGKYESNPNLEAIYGFLTKLGYEMSDEEKALADGTHELYMRDDIAEE